MTTLPSAARKPDCTAALGNPVEAIVLGQQAFDEAGGARLQHFQHAQCGAGAAIRLCVGTLQREHELDEPLRQVGVTLPFGDAAQHTLAQVHVGVDQAGQQNVAAAVDAARPGVFLHDLPALAHLDDEAALHRHRAVGDHLARRVHGEDSDMVEDHWLDVHTL